VWATVLKIVVIYRSISGFTQQYASWIAEGLQADLYDARHIGIDQLTHYDVIIFGGSLHAVGVNGVDSITQYLPQFTNKYILIFAVGASPLRESIIDEILKNNFTVEQQNQIKVFYLRGGFNYHKLDLKNKIIMTLYRMSLLLKRRRTPDEQGLLNAFSTPVDFTQKENIKGIIDYVQSLN
jgi:flavodoxin